MRSHYDILLVEDSPADAELILLGLHDAGLSLQVHHAHDGVEALDFLFARGAHRGRANRDQPSMVQLDIMLPKVDGLEVLRQVKLHERTGHLPVVMFTSSIVERDVRLAYENGANSYVQKPVGYDRLRTAL